jgi:hypothetical protein
MEISGPVETELGWEIIERLPFLLLLLPLFLLHRLLLGYGLYLWKRKKKQMK